MKRIVFATSLILMVALTACHAQKPNDDDRLKKSIVIDGINVSSMTVGEARQSLFKAANNRLMNTVITLMLPAGSTTFTAACLAADLDTETSLIQAAKLGARGGTRSIQSTITIDMEDLSSILSTYIQENESQPMDASVAVDRSLAVPVSYQAEQAGIDIDENALMEQVKAAIYRCTDCVIEVPYTQISPVVTVASIRSKQSLLAQYTTSFESAPYNAKNRVFNIQKAADAINGIELEDGETFDCNAILGDRTVENGWKEAAGIRNGRYESESGGGVCQVSSTLFNAVMMADLKITERHPHSWPMGYVEIGRDATISTGGKNFCFVNNSGAPVSLFMYVDNESQSVTASIYGRPLPGGQYIDIVSEKTGTLETAGEQIMLDESLPFNTRNIEREARDGKTAVTYKEYRSNDGQLLRREIIYRDTYRPIDGLTYVSTDIFYADTSIKP
ncbi:MAG: VanW family protein [Clostridia bacterium]